MKEDKKKFIEALGAAIADVNEETSKYYFDGIQCLKYVEEEDGEEYIYAVYNRAEGLEKRVCITADSVESILKDFANNIESANWITSYDRRYRRFDEK